MSKERIISTAIAELSGALTKIGPGDRAAIAEIAETIGAALEAGGKVLVCGNGGSAADAQHIAAELVGRFLLPDRRPLACIALTTDTSSLTAISNDFGFEGVFARQVRALGQEGDVLLALSTSGDSPNILAAAETARKLGMSVLAMTGASGGKLLALSQACFRAPAEKSYLVQELHQVAYHAVCEILDEQFA